MVRANKRSGALPFFAAVGVLVAMTWGGLAQQPHLRSVDDKALENASSTPDEWLTYGLDYAETRYSTLRLIDAANVSRLGPAWVAEIGPGGGGQEATPLISNGVLYAITNWSIVHAIDARTGKERWRFDPKVDRSMDQDLTDRVCCGVVQRGIALYQGKVYIPAIDGRLIAVDAESGTQVWETQTLPPNQPYSVTMAPRIVKGNVIVGSSGAEFAVRGFVSAYDAETGKLAWRFYTVPGDPSKPFEHPDLAAAARTWTGEWWKMGGGGTVWDAIAFDPDADLLYVGTGNGGPWNRDYRSPGGGDNWYLASILALRPDTGSYVWHYQTTPGDNWDYTAVQQLLLADIRIDGRDRKVIMQAPKNGFFYVLDRITGEFISAQPFANVSWAQGVDQKTGRPIVNPEAWYGPEGVTLSPGPGGAHNWAPMSYNPATGLVYLPASNSSYLYAKQPDFVFRRGEGEFQGIGRSQTAVARGGIPGTPPKAQPPIVGPEAGRDVRGGYLLAWDPVAQKERWRAAGGGAIGGGTVTTAGNLVLQVVPDGRFIAYSADNGEKLLEVATGQRGMGPPVTYQLDGRQYVSFLAGQGTLPVGRGGGAAGAAAPGAPGAPGIGVAPGGAPPPAGTPVAAGGGPAAGANPPPAPLDPVMNKPRVYTFVLDGKTPLPNGVARR
jgi:PQQ-dependent dehydrogenase (methanol/ethanol family)